MEKNKTTKEIENKTKQKDLSELEKKRLEYEKLKEEIKEIENKFTFKGLYQSISGRKNILKPIQNSNESDIVKFEMGIKTIKSYLNDLEEEYNKYSDSLEKETIN